MLFGKEELVKMSTPISNKSPDSETDVEMEEAADENNLPQEVADWVAQVSALEDALCDYGD